MSQTQNGGKPEVKDLPMKEPVGPKGINDPKTPGLHGENLGNNGTQGQR
jgi:hypothetical protein